MIVVTGAAGFIGSCLVAKLNSMGLNDVVLVDDFSNPMKNENFSHLSFSEKVERNIFFEWIKNHSKKVSFVFHLGARTDTAEFNKAVLDSLNLEYSKKIWHSCCLYNIPLVYASSAATYGLGEYGYEDTHDIIPFLKPLNPYGISKNEFDKWVFTQTATPPFWAGLKFFNVFGPNEYHKGRMASVVFHAFNQIQEKGFMQLFKSHKENFEDGKQLRDFVYVKDVVDVCAFMMEQQKFSGIYNLGTGNARTFLDLAKAAFKSLNILPDIRFIDTPLDIRDKYQYFTEAKMEKLLAIGYNKPFYSLEEAVNDYVVNYLSTGTYFGE